MQLQIFGINTRIKTSQIPNSGGRVRMQGAWKQSTENNADQRKIKKKNRQKKWHNEEINNFYSLFNIARIFNKVQLEEQDTYCECLEMRQMNGF